MNTHGFLLTVYHKLYSRYGPQHWWPGETPLEIALGAILTQNTSWANVEKAIENMKEEQVLSVTVLHHMPEELLAVFLKPAGYFNVKARRLKAFIDFLVSHFEGDIENMKKEDVNSLRKELLNVHGIGQETADSILLYALDKAVFVIDTYTKRVVSRHRVMPYDSSYEMWQALFHKTLGADAQLYNEYHALLVRAGKECCRPKPRCDACPLM
ncbi:MAG: endonuclease III domain-containing protein [Dissulfurispiraceae bacterium]